MELERPIEFLAVLIITVLILVDIHHMINIKDYDEARLDILFCLFSLFLLALIVFMS